MKDEIIFSWKKFKFLKITKESHNTFNLNGQIKLKADDNKLEEIIEKKRKYNIIKNYITNNIVIILIKYIIVINSFYKVKNNIFDYCFYLNSKITLKMKGIGQKKIMNRYFNYLDIIYINNVKQDELAQEYNFNQNENLVEIVLKDNINNTESMFQA